MNQEQPSSTAGRRGHLRVVPEISKLQPEPSDDRPSRSPQHPAGSRSSADEPFDHDRLW